MDLTASPVPAEEVTVARGVPAASVLFGGTLLSLVGLTWDLQWHEDVGPDTFFTLPHLFLYSGSGIAGLASLVVVLASTAAIRAGRPVDPAVGGRAVHVLGRAFAAPLGYLVSGVGAALFLIYGLWDQWWHGLYGFDAVINSPPHIGLLLSVSVTMIGTVMVFAAAGNRRWGRVGVLASLAVLLAFSTVTVLGLQDFEGVVSWINAGTGFLAVLFVLIAGSFLGRPGGVLATAVMLAAIQAAFWWFSPWAAHVYADVVGLPVRDYVRGIPAMPALMPMCLVPTAALLEVLLRGRDRSTRWLPVLAGGLGALVVAACAPLQNAWVYGTRLPGAGSVMATCVAGTALGLLGGFLGARFGRMLRLLAPTTTEGR